MTSDMTFFCKFIFTTIWIFGFGIGATVIFTLEGNAFLFFPWILGTAFLLWTWGRLKKITLSPFNTKLYISNFIKEIEVPFAEVEDISAFPLITPALIFICFKTPTVFGRRVIFMAPLKLFGSFTVYKTVEELKQTIQTK